MPHKLVRILAAAGLTLVSTACNHKSTLREYSQVDLANGATVSGTIHFAGAAPARIPIDMAQDPACAMSASPNLTEQYMVQNGALANVYISVTDGLGNRLYPAPRTPVSIDQRGCRFAPHVAAAMVGQPVQFTNSDATMHNVHMETVVPGDASFDVSQGPHGGPDTRQFHTPAEMLSLRCNNHPWMQAFLNVSANPFFAISGTDGRYTIQGLPPGTYTLTAVHEKLGKQIATITVAGKAAATADFTFKAAAQ
jgi:plastocyanin